MDHHVSNEDVPDVELRSSAVVDARGSETSYDFHAAKQLPFSIVYCSGQVNLRFFSTCTMLIFTHVYILFVFSFLLWVCECVSLKLIYYRIDTDIYKTRMIASHWLKEFHIRFYKIRLYVQDMDYPAAELNNGVLSRGWQSTRHVA